MVGRCTGKSVILVYPGVHPWAFTGGTISIVIVDISGESDADLDPEVLGEFKRE